MLRKYIYPYLAEAVNELARLLHSWGFKPNHLTLIGLVISLLAAIAYGLGFFLLGGLIVLASGLFDMLDGALARLSTQETAFGGFLDSVTDRYADFFIFSGILLHYLATGHPGLVVLILVVILGALLTSYAKARMECFGIKCEAGLIERAERLALVAIGSLPYLMVPVLWILAILSHVTVFQRIAFAQQSLTRRS